jgi:hypothetical protein
MTHKVNGRVQINGKQIDFTDGTGYIESDRGTSFPKRYAWTQCCWHDELPCSVMLSVADIPFLGGSFTGIIGAVSWRGQEYRIATYLGAKLVFLYRGRISVVQDKYMLTAELLDKRELPLRAPVSGSMIRLIRENPSCRVRFCFSHRDRVLFDFVSEQASFEYEYESR